MGLVLQGESAAAIVSVSRPKTFRARQIATNGTKLYVRVGGSGPMVVLLHGYGETGDLWVPLAEDLVPDHTHRAEPRSHQATTSRPCRSCAYRHGLDRRFLRRTSRSLQAVKLLVVEIAFNLGYEGRAERNTTSARRGEAKRSVLPCKL
jgi:hypothetical protein